MEMVLRTSTARVDRQRYRVIRNRRAVALAHDFTPLPGLPEKVRRQRFRHAHQYVSAKGQNRFIFEKDNKTGIMDEQWNTLYDESAEILYDKTLGLFYTGQGKNRKYIGIDGKVVKK